MDFVDREGVVNDYLKDLYEVKNPVGLLSTMIRDLLMITVSTKEYPLLARLIKLYGRKPVFNSVVEIAESTSLEVDKFPYGLLVYLCKRSIGLTEETSYRDHPLLTDFIDRVDKEITKNSKHKKEVSSD